VTPADYLAHRRSLFYPKTDEPVVGTRHHIDWAANRPTLRRYSFTPHDYSMIAEGRVIEAAHKAGVPVARVKTVRFEPTQSWQEMEVAQGATIARLVTPGQKLAAYKDLGRTLAILHAVDARGAGLIDPFSETPTGLHGCWVYYLQTNLISHLDYATKHNLLDQAEVHYVSSKLGGFISQHKWANFPTTLLHGDLNDHNVFVQQDLVTAIIDWEDALIGDPIFDLAYWATFVAHTPDTWPTFLDSYFLHAGPKPSDFDLRFWTYYLRISLSKLVQLHRYGVSDLTFATNRIENGLNHLLP